MMYNLCCKNDENASTYTTFSLPFISHKYIMLYGFFVIINSSSFLALASFLLIRVTMIDVTMLINQLWMDCLSAVWPQFVLMRYLLKSAYYMCSSELKENALQVEYFLGPLSLKP